MRWRGRGQEGSCRMLSQEFVILSGLQPLESKDSPSVWGTGKAHLAREALGEGCKDLRNGRHPPWRTFHGSREERQQPLPAGCSVSRPDLMAAGGRR